MSWKIRERLERTTGWSAEPQDDLERQENWKRESVWLPGESGWAERAEWSLK